jgi:hypothetical protein
MKVILLLIPILIFAFNESNKSNYFKVLQQRQDPYVFDKKERLELKKVKIEAETKKEIAKIEYKKAVDTQKIKKDTVIQKATKEIEKEKISVNPKELAIKAKEKMIFYIFIFAILSLVLILLLYRHYQKTKEKIEMEKLKAQKEAHEKEMALKDREIQANIATKLIDAIASGKLTKEQEEKLLNIANKNIKLIEK